MGGVDRGELVGVGEGRDDLPQWDEALILAGAGYPETHADLSGERFRLQELEHDGRVRVRHGTGQLFRTHHL